jgi:hypothetical protein
LDRGTIHGNWYTIGVITKKTDPKTSVLD